jgi:hypothetical protein
MCFLHSQKLTDELKESTKDKEFVEMYKIFGVNSDNELVSPIRRNRIFSVGEHVDLNCRKIEYNEVDAVEHCFHCFDDLNESLKIHDMLYNNFFKAFKLIKIRVKPKDIISKGPLIFFDERADGKINSVGIKAFTLDQDSIDNPITIKEII